MTDQMSDPSHDGGPPVDLADLVTRCILAFEVGGDAAVDEVLAGADGLADEARGQLRALRDAGLLAPPAPEPETIGPYRVLQRLGRGAVGSVYLAEQRDGVRRQVAIKVIRPGMDTREVLARFAVERQALALLDHPNIARVLDAGATVDGRPYLCMEYVPGQPITRYCDERRLDVTERVRLMAAVCDAVHAAHQKGILHRDLKPSNVLVADRNGRPWPTVIDFGVAKSLGPRLLDVTLVTGRGRLIGTPEYMSPEQAANEIDVDIRTDVHALGVVLHELLCGRLPLSSERLRKADERELLRILGEEVAPPLRTALRGEDAARIAELRGASVPSLSRALTGELDWIVHKAIEKDRNRRYGVIAELAADLRRHLASEPVAAGPQRTLYRWRKFVRRNAVPVASAAAVGAALVLGLGASLSFYVDAAEKAEQSEQSLGVALAAVERMVQAGEHDLGLVPRMDLVRRRLLDEALALHERLRSHQDDADVLASRVGVLVALGKVHGQLGEFDQALQRGREATSLLERVPDDGSLQRLHLETSLLFAQANWVEVLDGTSPVVAEMLDRACLAAERLLGEAGGVRRHGLLVANVFGRRGASLEATDAEAAERWFARAREIVDPMLDGGGEVPAAALEVLAHHGRFCVEVGAKERAVAVGERLQSALDRVWSETDDPVVRGRFARSLEQLGSIWNRTATFERSRPTFERLIELRRALLRDFPGMSAHRSGLALALGNRAIADEQRGALDEAAAAFREAASLYTALADQHPDVENYAHLSIQAAVNVAQHYLGRTSFGMPLERDAVLEAVARARARLDLVPGSGDPEWVEAHAEVERLEGFTAQLRGLHEPAIEALRRAIARYEQLLVGQPERVWLGERLTECHRLLAGSLRADGRLEEARTVLTRVVELVDGWPASFQQWNAIRSQLRHGLGVRAQLSAEVGDFAACMTQIADYLAAEREPGDWIGHETAARTCLQALEVARQRGQEPWCSRFAERARGLLTDALEFADGDHFENVDPRMLAIMRSNSLAILVDVELACDDASAASRAQHGVVHGYRVAFDARSSQRNRERLAGALQKLVELCDAAGDAAGADAGRAELEGVSGR